MLFYCAIYECFYNTVLTVSRKKELKDTPHDHLYTLAPGHYPWKFAIYNLLKGFCGGLKEEPFLRIMPI